MIQKFLEALEKKACTLKRLLNIKSKPNQTDYPKIPPVSMYTKIRIDAEPGVLITFSFTPRSYMKSLTTAYIETLLMPLEIVESDSVWEAYSHFCSRIYEYDRAKGLLMESWERETDIYLWIKPYEEPTFERDMNGVLRPKMVRPTKRVNRLRRRMLFVKWMLENSDWQEQLVLHYWNLPRKGAGGSMLLPWFTLEVEYRRGARAKLYKNWKSFEIEAAPRMRGPSGKVESGGENISSESGGSMLETLGSSIEGIPIEVGEEDGDAEADNGEYAPEVPQHLAEDGTALATGRDGVSLVGGEAPVSYEDILNAACEVVLKSETPVVGGNKALLGDGVLVRPVRASVKSAGIKIPVSEISVTRAGEIECQPIVDVGVGEIEEFKFEIEFKEKAFLIAT